MLNAASTNHSSVYGNGQAAFLRRLSQDDRFRAELQADPQAALAEYGIHVDSDQLPSVVTLPKEEAVSFVLEETENSGVGPRQQHWFGIFG